MLSSRRAVNAIDPVVQGTEPTFLRGLGEDCNLTVLQSILSTIDADANYDELLNLEI